MTLRASFRPGMPLTDYGPDHVAETLAGMSPQPNPLFSEELSDAHRRVLATQDPKLIKAVNDVAQILLTGDLAQGSSSGFGIRQALGIRIRAALEGEGFDVSHKARGLDNLGPIDTTYAGDKQEILDAKIEALQARLELHVATRKPSGPAPVAGGPAPRA